MNFIARVCFLVISFSLAGCNYSKIYVSGDTLHFETKVSKENIDDALLTADKSDTKITKIIVNSSGGDVESGIRFGHWIYDNNLSLIVKRKCLSSCANYFFTASKDVLVLKGALVGWHGGATQFDFIAPDTLTEVERFEWESNLNKMKRLENDFFNKVGIDQRITVFGQFDNYKKLKEAKNCEPEIYKGWTYPIKTIEKFGFKSLRFTDTKPTLAKNGINHLCVIDVSNEEWNI
jgi:hypothetical protein